MAKAAGIHSTEMSEEREPRREKAPKTRKGIPLSLQVRTDPLMDFRELPKAEERVPKTMLME